MPRIIALALSCLVVSFVPSVAAAQTETVRYYHTDAVGSVRMITDETGQVVQRYDYWPTGVPTDTPTVPESRRFAGEERDAATRLDYFGARDYQSHTGRFTTPDPITVNALRLVNPQRWNRYAYAINNPLRYVDPDGLDALLVNYTDGAYGFGHIGIMALNPDGSGLYGGFNPVHGRSPVDFRGVVATLSVSAGFVQFGMDGRPTDASLTRLRQRLAALDGKSAQAIRIRHIKTSGAETAALDAYIQHVRDSPPFYAMGVNDCLDFCVRGLWSAGIPAPPPSAVPGGAIPDAVLPVVAVECGQLAGGGVESTHTEGGNLLLHSGAQLPVTARLHAMLARSVFLTSLLVLVGCVDPPTPPPGVPSGATPVTYSKNGGWAYCWFDAAANVNRCRTYNWRGERLYRADHERDDDDVYLRYEGTGPVSPAELQIDELRTQPDYVWLKNGVILLPRNAFDLYKADVDKQMRIREAEGRR